MVLTAMRSLLSEAKAVNADGNLKTRLRTTTLFHEAAAKGVQYKLLADNSTDVIVRLGFDGLRRYVSPRPVYVPACSTTNEAEV